MAKQTHLTNAGLKSASSYNPNQTTATILTTEVVQNHNHNHHKRPSIDHENTIRSRKISESTNHERIRRTSTSTSSTNRTNNGIGEFIRSNLLQRSNFFNLALLLVISVLTNSIYFNLFYLPALHRSLDERSIKKLELPASGNSYFGLNNLLSFSSLITWPSLPFAPSESQSESGSVPAPSSAYPNLPRYRIKSFEHVAFPPLDDDQFGGSPDPSEESSYIGLLDTDAESESQKKSLETRRKESQMALKLALTMQRRGKPNKASKIFKYALSLDPRNPELLVAYGEYLERHKKDIVRAEHYYTKVVHIEPEHENAQVNLRRATPMVSKIDREMLDSLDGLLTRFYEIPSTNSALRRAKKDAYFMHIYHSNAIEGNTLNLQQTRHIIENRMAVGGKSVQEHNEVLGLDAAMRFINQTLLYKPLEKFGVEDVLEIHRRVLGFCDPIESGRFRKHQVYVGKFTPPSADHVEQLMLEFIEWLNSNQLQQAHPIQIAALVHYKFVFIHPFYDGNGRTGRLLMNLILMKFGYPPVIIRKQERLEYYEYLEMANQGDIKPFVRFIARCTQRTLQEYIKLCNDSYSISVDDSAKMFRGDLVLNTFDDDYFRDTAKTGENNNDDADDEDDGGEPIIGESFINTGKFSFLPTQDDDGEN